MGYQRHHAIVVTSYDEVRIKAAHAEAQRLGCMVTPIIGVAVNFYHSFMIGPDGSKQGWDESDAGDARRDAFAEWLDAQAFGDGSSPYDWAEVQYGDDNLESRLVRSGDQSYLGHLWLSR